MKTFMNDGDNHKAIASLFQLMGHPTRLAIINSLRDGKKCVNDVCELLKVPQPNLSQHLAILRREKIVKVAVEGSRRCYELTNQKLINALLLAYAENCRRNDFTMEDAEK